MFLYNSGVEFYDDDDILWVTTTSEERDGYILYHCYQKNIPSITTDFEEDAITNYIKFNYEN